MYLNLSKKCLNFKCAYLCNSLDVLNVALDKTGFLGVRA